MIKILIKVNIQNWFHKCNNTFKNDWYNWFDDYHLKFLYNRINKLKRIL